jgi:ABC-type nickel/cobalt efflux system permease component RcnA
MQAAVFGALVMGAHASALAAMFPHSPAFFVDAVLAVMSSIFPHIKALEGSVRLVQVLCILFIGIKYAGFMLLLAAICVYHSLTHTHKHTDTHTDTHTQTQTDTHTHPPKYTFVCVCARAHAHTQSHTHASD